MPPLVLIFAPLPLSPGSAAVLPSSSPQARPRRTSDINVALALFINWASSLTYWAGSWIALDGPDPLDRRGGAAARSAGMSMDGEVGDRALATPRRPQERPVWSACSSSVAVSASSRRGLVLLLQALLLPTCAHGLTGRMPQAASLPKRLSRKEKQAETRELQLLEAAEQVFLTPRRASRVELREISCRGHFATRGAFYSNFE